VIYRLVPVSDADAGWLEQLRRRTYAELFLATFGAWDESRHMRHTEECWRLGHMRVIEVDGERVGMIQQFDRDEAVEIGEIQIQPLNQNQGIGALVLRDVIDRSHIQGKSVVLSVGLKNDRAYRFYQRTGFRHVRNTETHSILSCDP
jgi:GNAT superfamily N-acetyltransferase